MTDYYRDLAVDYDWLFDDNALTNGFAIAGLREVGTDFSQAADQYVVTAAPA